MGCLSYLLYFLHILASLSPHQAVVGIKTALLFRPSLSFCIFPKGEAGSLKNLPLKARHKQASLITFKIEAFAWTHFNTPAKVALASCVYLESVSRYFSFSELKGKESRLGYSVR